MRADEVGRIVHRMLEEQVRQGNPRDPEVFVTMLTADLEQGIPLVEKFRRTLILGVCDE